MGRLSVKLPWMNEFSDYGIESNLRSYLRNLDDAQSHYHLHYKNQGSIQIDQIESCMTCVDNENLLKKYHQHLDSFSELSFNIFELSRKVDRRSVLPVMAYNGFKEMNLLELIDQSKFGLFLNKV